MSSRGGTLAGWLTRLGFVDAKRAVTMLSDGDLVAAVGDLAEDDPAGLLAALADVADPDQALLSFTRIAGSVRALPAERALLTELAAPGPGRDRLLAVVGASVALGDMLAAHPDELALLLDLTPGTGVPVADVRAELLVAVGADPGAEVPVAAPAAVGPAGWDAMRRAYRARLLRIAATDLTSPEPLTRMPGIAAALADLAAAALEAALAIARAELDDHGAGVRLAVLGMGKCGGRELNYVSDVDVIYVAEPADGVDEQHALTVGARLATGLAAACANTSREPALWPVDAALRPEGKNGPLVRTLDSHRAYYERWASTWEYQALLKARPVAGDRALGEAYVAAMNPMVWAAVGRENFVADSQAMRRRVEEHVPPAEADRQLKLGVGGLRDVEFTVQLLQLVHGRADESIRSPSTLTALAALAAGGYVGRENFVADSQAMRRRVEEHVPPAEADRQLKLGVGGLRDVEFTVQLLQLVHGRADESIRSPSTLTALAALAAGGYVGRESAARLAVCYRLLRALEHRIQLYRLRRTHLMPTADADLRRLARSVGMRAEGAEGLMERWRTVRREVRDLHLELFYRPLLPATAQLSADEARLAPDVARARLAAIGYRDPVGAMRHIAALTEGVSRRAAIQRQLLPVMLGWFAEGADADAGLLNFRRLSDTLGSTHWYLRLLRDSGTAAARLARVLSTSRYVAEAMARSPESVAWLADEAELTPRSPERLAAEADAVLLRADEPVPAATALRALRRRELARTGAADVLGVVTSTSAAESLSAAADVVLAGGLRIAAHETRAERGLEQAPTQMLVVAMGRLGGREVGYSSDADVMFVHDPLPGQDATLAQQYALSVASRLRHLLGEVGAEPVLDVDADLRPEGRNGPLVRSFASYAEYYQRWSAPWESQALLRARPVAGDPDLGDRFVALVDPLRYPAGGLQPADVREVRRIKARVEAERLPRGVEPARHLKLGRGGLADVEWTVQLLQLQHAHAVPSLRTTSTLGALSAAVAADLIDADDAATLTQAWVLASRLRDAQVLWSGRSGGAHADQLPHDLQTLAGLARVLGYPAGSGAELEEDYLRSARRARAVVERVFYAYA